MKYLLKHLKKYKLFVIFGPLFKLFEAVLELFNPILVARIIDYGVNSGDYLYITKYAIIIVMFNIVGFAFAVIGQKCASLTSAGVSTSMRQELFVKVTNFSHKELDSFGTATIINRLTNDINQIENAINTFMRSMVRTPFLLIGAFVLSLFINKKMSLIFLVLIPVVSIILLIYMKKTVPQFKNVRVKLDNVAKLTRENLSGTRVIRAFNMQEKESEKFNSATGDLTKTVINISKISSLLEPLILLIVDAAVATLLILGGIEINIGGMTKGNLIALIDYVSIITISLLLMSEIISIFVRTSASLHRYNEIIDIEPRIKEKIELKKVSNKDYQEILEFKNVSFNYNMDSETKSFIKDLSFKVYPHQTIGIIGGTGSGKSTIASLILLFYDVTSGEILFKGENIKNYSLKQLRNEISIVQQRSSLFSGSLRKNMQLRNPNATDEEIVEALKVSQSWQFVQDWPNKLDYQIMAGGKNVSGGQMQRLTIARALINKPDLLILDDSSSALDFLTDSNLRKAIKKLDLTTIIISQRATSIKNADLIIVLDNGDVVGMGKHNDLLNNCEIYKEIYESQSK